MHEDVFRELHREILAHDTHGPDWNGRRTFAVDGSRINLPRPLAEAGYPLPSGGAHYPQGLLSCLYRLDSRMPVDFTLTSGADERAAARAHLGALSPGDVVVFDRGYFSFVLLRDMTARGLHPVFRIQRNSAAGFDRFRDGDRDDALVRITPGKNALRRLKAAGIPEPSSPIVLRLVRYEIGESRYVLAKDPRRYGAIQPERPLGTPITGAGRSRSCSRYPRQPSRWRSSTAEASAASARSSAPTST